MKIIQFAINTFLIVPDNAAQSQADAFGNKEYKITFSVKGFKKGTSLMLNPPHNVKNQKN